MPRLRNSFLKARLMTSTRAKTRKRSMFNAEAISLGLKSSSNRMRQMSWSSPLKCRRTSRTVLRTSCLRSSPSFCVSCSYGPGAGSGNVSRTSSDTGRRVIRGRSSAAMDSISSRVSRCSPSLARISTTSLSVSLSRISSSSTRMAPGHYRSRRFPVTPFTFHSSRHHVRGLYVPRKKSLAVYFADGRDRPQRAWQ